MLRLFKKRRESKSRIGDVLGDFELPSFPGILMTAMERVRNEDASLTAIADILTGDPGFSVRLLGTVNSAAFALRYPVKNVHHAVSLLGRAQLESMLISMAVREALPRTTVPGYDASRFWTTAARRAATAGALADRIDPSTRSESFTAALLQDMALPVLAHQKTEEYGPVLEQWHNDGEDLARLEQGAFGWDHTEIGEWMCGQWKFPADLAQSIGVHHGEATDEEVALPAVNLVSVIREVGEDAGVEQMIETVYSGYGLAKDDTLDLLRESFENAASIAALFT